MVPLTVVKVLFAYRPPWLTSNSQARSFRANFRSALADLAAGPIAFRALAASMRLSRFLSRSCLAQKLVGLPLN